MRRISSSVYDVVPAAGAVAAGPNGIELYTNYESGP
jgi:hypothetical protein